MSARVLVFTLGFLVTYFQDPACKEHIPIEINMYRTRANISRGLYFFYPIFILAAAYIADNLCTKNGKSSFFKLKIRGL